MKKMILDEEEKEILSSYERGEWKSVKNSNEEIERLRKYARNTLQKDKRIKPAGVLLSPGDYDELVYKKDFLDSVGRGIWDSEKGNAYSSEELKAALAARRSK